ncbi:AMP-binding protein [Enterovirga aerilata]|uniref:3-methylmercaptopropionyl-CoA ligase n=1 Tax=Enterovirga aerilata TaxID=2730920 RepID=A0A849I4Y5_9HYPH|nr:AMP-binding protein [Enterovirga sp. DB1703]NNM72764.1 AMP-binding protein [Enterovirga sp. DB1703]
MNVFTCLDRAAARFGDRPGLFSGTEPVASFAEIRRRALGIAGGLRRRWPQGSRFALASENRPEYVELLFGIWAAGCAAVPVNAKLHPKEIRAVLEDAEVAALFASPKLARALAAEGGAPAAAIVISEADYAELLAAEPLACASVAPQDLAWLFYTSGTTGRSKGAMLSHRSLMAMTLSHLADLDDPDETTCLIHGAPMSHGSGLYILPYLSRGAAQVVPASSSFEPDEFLDLCDVHRGCAAFLAPTMVQRIRRAAEERGRSPRHLRSVVYGGGPMYVEELKKARAVFGEVFAQLYGQGEAPMTITGLSRREHAGASDAVLGSVGWARSGVEVRVAGPDGRTLPPGEVGEVVCRGDILMSGYWRNPEATAQTIHDGWLFTGDVGSMDETGCLTLRDRSKDVVISGGTNIYPREVEEALLTHPDVEEVCVVGAPDPEWGEVVVAFVVPRTGASLTHEALDAHCLARIARFKRPKSYRWVETLPKNSYGKVLKRDLRLRLG